MIGFHFSLAQSFKLSETWIWRFNFRLFIFIEERNFIQWNLFVFIWFLLSKIHLLF